MFKLSANYNADWPNPDDDYVCYTPETLINLSSENSLVYIDQPGKNITFLQKIVVLKNFGLTHNFASHNELVNGYGIKLVSLSLLAFSMNAN